MDRKKINKKKILVVDDDQGILDSLKIILEMEGYEVISLLSADNVYREIQLHRPSLIILDIWLSHGVDGVEVARVLKAQEEYKHIPVILISALSNIEKIIKSCDADDFLAKPFEIDDVIGKVTRYI